MRYLLVLFLLITTPCYGAEFLVMAQDHWQDELTQAEVDKLKYHDIPNYYARSQKGDIVVVKPDGWNWGKRERLPRYVVVKVPGISYKEAKAYETNLMEEISPAFMFIPAQYQIVRQHKYSFSEAEVELAKVGNLNAIQVSKAVFQTKTTEKTGLSAEVSPPKTGVIANLKYRTRPLVKMVNNFVNRKVFAADNAVSIAPSGGDYTTLEGALDGEEGDYVTATNTVTFTISGDWSGGADSTAASINNYTLDSDYYMTIITTGDARHDGTSTGKSSAYELDATLSISVGNETDSDTNIFINGLDISDQVSGSGTNFIRMQFTYNIVHDNTQNASILHTGSYGTWNMWNNAIYGAQVGEYNGGVQTADYTEVNVYNNVVADIAFYGFWNEGNGTFVSKNTYVDADDTCFSGMSAGSDYNASSDDTADDVGSNNVNNVAFSTSAGAYFTNVTDGSEDFHITNTSSELYQVGDDLSGTFTDDIDGDTRSDWDIGIDYITSGSPPAARRMFLL